MKIAIVGAHGYSGSHLTEEALRRGHQVIAVSRTAPPDARPGVEVRAGSIFDAALVESIGADADVLAVAIKAQTPSGSLVDAVPNLLATAVAHGARLGVVGGSGSLRTFAGGPAMYQTPEFPQAFLPEARAQGAALAALEADDGKADWFYLSPPIAFGRHAPGERTGAYRTGTDVVLDGSDGGMAAISGPDYAIAFLDEVETPRHARTRFTVAS